MVQRPGEAYEGVVRSDASRDVERRERLRSWVAERDELPASRRWTRWRAEDCDVRVERDVRCEAVRASLARERLAEGASPREELLTDTRSPPAEELRAVVRGERRGSSSGRNDGRFRSAIYRSVPCAAFASWILISAATT